MKLKQKGAIIGIIVLLVTIVLGIFMNWWPLGNILLNIVPYFLIGGIIALFLWGFREGIEQYFHKNGRIKSQITKIIGHPDSVGNGIQYYNRRSHLPFDEFLAQAHQRVDMLAVTFHCVTTSHIRLIEETIYRGIRVTFLILDPNSRNAESRKADFHEGEEAKHHIERSLHVLCELKERLKDEYKDNLVIKKYDDIINESITIIDNKLIKIERHAKGSDSGSRPNELAFNTDNQSFFQRYSQGYQKIKPVDYRCSD
jgi:hypothetical protein